MSWPSGGPTQRNYGDLITSSIWNTDLRDALRYLKGMDGQVTLEDDLIPNTAALTIGESANPWGQGHFYDLYAGPRYAVHKNIREVTIDWMTDDIGAQIDGDGGPLVGSGTIDFSGHQAVLQINDDVVGSYYYICQKAASTGGKATTWNPSRYPYGRFEFSLDGTKDLQEVYIGFRQTPSSTNPSGATENLALLYMSSSSWGTEVSAGSGGATSGESAPADDTRHVLEIYINGASSVEFWLDGSLIHTHSSNLPTGELYWFAQFYSDGSGSGGADSYLTIGRIILQENLS